MAISRPLLLAAAAATTLAGCAATSSELDARHGESLATIKARQTRDPSAALSNANKSVDGMPAQAATNSVDRYYKSFATPPAPMNIINIGGIGVGGSQ